MPSSRAVVLATLVLAQSSLGFAQAPLPAQTTAGAATLRGRVVDETSSPVGRARIAVAANGMPLDAVFADAEGRFEIVPSLPPREYWVAAVDSIEGDSISGDWQSSDLLNRLTTSARRVVAGEGQRVSTELRLVRLVR